MTGEGSAPPRLLGGKDQGKVMSAQALSVRLSDKAGTVWRLVECIWFQFAAGGSVAGDIWEGNLSLIDRCLYQRDLFNHSCFVQS